MRNIKLISFFIFLLILVTNGYGQNPYLSDTTRWSVRMAESVMTRHPNNYSNSWGYTEGTVLKSFEELWRSTNDNRYFQYIHNSVNAGFYSTGELKSYTFSNFSLDDICEGRMLLFLKEEGITDTKYQNAIDTLREQLREQPRTTEGGFWHRDNVAANAYPNQMWLDGLYMANPFYAEYGVIYNEPSDLEDAVLQLTIMEEHARDSTTGLLYHGWDESKTQAWANPVTGCSPSFWGRGDGWYAMAVVDVLDYLPPGSSIRAKAIGIIQRLAAAIKKVQDPVHGTWYQVLDQGTREGNYRESSASCMFVYALAKAIRLGYIDSSYWDVVKKGYTGILDEFITENSNQTINLIQTCLTAGLGGNPYRDGSFNYYVYQTQKSINDPKAVGPFILASLEVERAGFVVPPLDFHAVQTSDSTVSIKWTDKSYNAKSFSIERRTDSETQFQEIDKVPKSTTSFVDSNIEPNKKYYYRAKAISDSSFSDYTPTDTIIASVTGIKENKLPSEGFKLQQNYPNPFNPTTVISYTVPPAQNGQHSFVQLKVYDILGHVVATLVNKQQSTGSYNVTFNATNLSNGIYFCRLRAAGYSATNKMVLLK